MISLVPARPDQIEMLLDLIYHQTTAYLQPKLDLIQMTSGEFGQFFRSTGEILCVVQDDQVAGLCWLQRRDAILFIYGLIVKDEFQGQGIGSQVLGLLEKYGPGKIEALELWVHCSNPRARALYERCGFGTVRYLDESGFYVMRKGIDF